MKKIKLIIGLMLFLTPTICFAKDIKIDLVNYSVDDVLELNGITYNANTDTVILNNANLISIQSDNNLNIIVNGDNTIDNHRTIAECIRGKIVNITGNGTLNLLCQARGITANKVNINNTTIFGDVGTSMFVLNGTNPSLSINNSNFVFKDGEISFYILNGGVDINNSNVIIQKTNKLGYDTLKFINVTNSSFDVLDTIDFLNGTGVLNVDSNSKVFMHSLNGFDETKLLGNNIKYLGSVDNSNYHDNVDTLDKYVKVLPAISLESELLNLEKEKEELEQEITKLEERNMELNKQEEELTSRAIELNNQEESNNLKAKELETKESELLELSEGLTKKEEELTMQENNINASSKTLDARESSIEALSNILLGKQNEVNTLENSIENEKLEIESLKRYLSLKEKELQAKESKLLQENETNLKDELLIFEDEGGIEDDIIENTYKNSGTSSNIIDKLGSVCYLLISYVSGIVTHIVSKRRLNG